MCRRAHTATPNLFWSAGTLRENAKFLPVLIVLMCSTMAVGHTTMLKALRKYLTGGTVNWTKWERQGVDGAAGPGRAPSFPTVNIPGSIIEALNDGHPALADLDGRWDAGLDALVGLDPASATDKAPAAARPPGQMSLLASTSR